METSQRLLIGMVSWSQESSEGASTSGSWTGLVSNLLFGVCLLSDELLADAKTMSVRYIDSLISICRPQQA